MLMTSPYSISGQETGRETTDLAGLVDILRRGLPQILVTTALALLLAVLYLVFAAPSYTSNAVLYINPSPNRVVNETAPAPNSTGADLAIVDSQVAIISSDAMLRRVVDTLSLDKDSEFSGAGPLTKLKSLLSNSAAPDAKALAAEKLAKRIKILRAQKTYIVEVEATASSPAKAAQITDTLISLYLADQATARAEDERRANELITGRLGELRDEVRQAEDRVDDFKRRNGITVSEGGIVGEQQLGKLNGELVAARATAAEAKGRLDAVRSAAASSGAALDAMPEAVRSATIQRLREQHAQVARRVASLSSQLKSRHPVLIEARSQLGEIRAQIDAELRRIANALAAEYRIASSRELELQRLIETSKAEVSRTSTAQIKLRELEQDVATSRDVLGTFLQRAKETREQEQISVPYARVVSPATAPSKPSWPINWLVLGLGAFGGLGLGIVRVLAGAQLDTTVRLTPRTFQLGNHALFPIPALGEARLSRIGSVSSRLPALRGTTQETEDLGRALVAVSEPESAAETAYRQSILHLLASFEQDRHDSYPSAIMLCGADRESEAASVALALAQSGALRGERVLLVDACSTDATLSATLAPDLTEGWATLLAKPEALAAHTVRDSKSSLAFLPLASADLRLLKRGERRQLAANLAAAALDYDLVIIDGGALASDESASALLPLVDKVAIVARSGKTPQHRLDDLLRALAPVRDKISGVILTGTGVGRA